MVTCLYKWFANKSSLIIVMKIILKVKYEKKKKYFLKNFTTSASLVQLVIISPAAAMCIRNYGAAQEAQIWRVFPVASLEVYS